MRPLPQNDRLELHPIHGHCPTLRVSRRAPSPELPSSLRMKPSDAWPRQGFISTSVPRPMCCSHCRHCPFDTCMVGRPEPWASLWIQFHRPKTSWTNCFKTNRKAVLYHLLRLNMERPHGINTGRWWPQETQSHCLFLVCGSRACASPSDGARLAAPQGVPGSWSPCMSSRGPVLCRWFLWLAHRIIG